MSQNAVVKSKKTIYVVWIIPVMAMALAGWMIYKHFDDKGIEITITFQSGDGLTVGKTPLIYNGLKIGEVTGLVVNSSDISNVDATITVEKRATLIAKKGNIFWKVEPKVSLTEITGLSTILSGSYIGVRPSGNTKEKLSNLPDQFVFTAEPDTPIDHSEPGLRLQLTAKDSAIKEGAPILFRNINVGKVEEVKLTRDGVAYLIHIEEEYAAIVKENSRFWQISGVELQASLAGVHVKMDSLASVIAGGISFSSPEASKPVGVQKPDFKLYESHEQTLLDDDFIFLTAKSGYNIDTKFSSVYFKGTDAGVIDDVTYDPGRGETKFKIQLNKSFRHLANKDAYFWIVEPAIGLEGIKGLDAIARGPYIAFETESSSSEVQQEFKLHANAPSLKGESFRLLAKKGYNLKAGVNVVYNDIIIGTVTKSYITDSLNEVAFDIVVAEKYKNLVNESSSFYIQSAIESEISLSGMYFNIGSLASMLHSGIVLVTPDLKATTTQKSFALYESRKDYDDYSYRTGGGKVFSLITKELRSIKKGSAITYKGISVGKVVDYHLVPKADFVEVDIYIEKPYLENINASTLFYNVSGIEVKASLSGVKVVTDSVRSIIEGGIEFKTPLKVSEKSLPKSFKLFDDEDKADENYVSFQLRTNKEVSLKEGSEIVYKTISIGQIQKVKLKNDELVFEAIVDKEYDDILVQDTKFWVEEFSFSIDQIKNPAAAVTGSFINVMKGNKLLESKSFTLQDESPAPTINKEGLRIVVIGSRLGSLKIGSPVFYRQIQIGSVEAAKLTGDSTGVEIKVFIEPKYSYLIRENSIFYIASAIGVEVDLLGVTVTTETLSTMIHGGISMVVPDEPERRASDMHTFKLHNEADEDWLEYEPVLKK
ncbi:MAG: MlaD family protein [Lentisphaeraceae bacterium]|nr:MlaD family protein [Lentisphaeraceae bacterium]